MIKWGSNRSKKTGLFALDYFDSKFNNGLRAGKKEVFLNHPFVGNETDPGKPFYYVK